MAEHSDSHRVLRGSRVTRSAVKAHAKAPAKTPSPPISASIASPTPSNGRSSIRKIAPGSTLPFISAADLTLLRQKQAKLRRTAASTARPTLAPAIRHALGSTWIFAQYEAGTAVCIDSSGWILTCAHCFGDTDAEIEATMPARRWLLSVTGSAILTECVAWDTRRDLALLAVVAVETDDSVPVSFPYVSLSTREKMNMVFVVCIGQPGADDLEAEVERKTLYDLFEISEGRLKGLVPGVDAQDNREIGTLRHDAWTYWGHSGAPILREDDASLVGVHSSWDDRTAMRHAVPLVAIRAFLEEQLQAAKDASEK